jgi:hypothetical protein
MKISKALSKAFDVLGTTALAAVGVGLGGAVITALAGAGGAVITGLCELAFYGALTAAACVCGDFIVAMSSAMPARPARAATPGHAPAPSADPWSGASCKASPAFGAASGKLASYKDAPVSVIGGFSLPSHSA